MKVKLLAFLFCLLFLFSTAFAGEKERLIGEILYSGEITDDDAQRLKRSVMNDLGGGKDLSSECNDYMDFGMNAVMAGELDLNKAMSKASLCADSINKDRNKRRSTKRKPPPLPQFQSDGWCTDRLQFGTSFYKVIKVAKGNMYKGWPQAQYACWDDHRGRLATIESDEEDAFVRSLVEQYGPMYIGILRKWTIGGKKEPRWIRHVASGQDQDVNDGYTNWADGHPSTKLKNTKIISPHVGYWGVYGRTQNSALAFWKSAYEYGWSTIHPGQLLESPVEYALCEWDLNDWKRVKEVKELGRNRMFNNHGGVLTFNGKKFKF